LNSIRLRRSDELDFNLLEISEASISRLLFIGAVTVLVGCAPTHMSFKVVDEPSGTTIRRLIKRTPKDLLVEAVVISESGLEGRVTRRFKESFEVKTPVTRGIDYGVSGSWIYGANRAAFKAYEEDWKYKGTVYFWTQWAILYWERTPPGSLYDHVKGLLFLTWPAIDVAMYGVTGAVDVASLVVSPLFTLLAGSLANTDARINTTTEERAAVDPFSAGTVTASLSAGVVLATATSKIEGERWRLGADVLLAAVRNLPPRATAVTLSLRDSGGVSGQGASTASEA
jgi:hypothetical protein